MRSLVAVVASVSVAVAAVAGCSSSRPANITVFAAASLKTTFTELGAQFENDHPGTKVAFNFAGSSDLVTQLVQGAPADVFASADTSNMTKAAAAGVVSGVPVDFATNTLIIITSPGNPKNIATFADLDEPDTEVVICAPQVPCGSATERVEKAAGVTLAPVSEERSVTDVLGKITSGQADAGLVYVTDAETAREKVAAIAFPESADAANTYPIAVLKDSMDPTAAQQFVDLVSSRKGQEALLAAGFAAPA